MKALKEKRNSIRSLWRMGLVILSVFVFALAFGACGDGITADPSGGQPAEVPGPTDVVPPPSEVPPPVATTSRYVTVIEVTGTVNVFSFEGQRPDISGVTLNVYWSDGGMTPRAGHTATLANGFYTSPAILSEAHLASWQREGEAAYDPALNDTAYPVDIEIFHASNPSASAKIRLPGVNAIDGDYSNASIGFKNGFRVDGNVTEFWEDDEVSFAGVTAYAWYKGIIAPDPYDVPDATFAALSGRGLEPGYQQLPLSVDYIFSDYWAGFPAQQSTNSAADGVRYAYGVDPAKKSLAGTATDTVFRPAAGGTVFIMVSRAATPARHDAAPTNSKYIGVGLTDFRFIRYIDIETPPTWVGSGSGASVTAPSNYFFEDDWNLSSRPETGNVYNNAATVEGLWWNNLLTSGIKLNVYYYSDTDTVTALPDPKVRDITHMARARRLQQVKVSGLPNFRLLDEEGADAVNLRLSYYGSEVDGYNQAKVNSGSYPNEALNIPVPLATFNETLSTVRTANTVRPQPLQWYAPTTAVTAFPAALLVDITRHYTLVGNYTTPTGGAATKAVTFRSDFFTNYRELGRYTETQVGSLDLEITISRNALTNGWVPSSKYVGLSADPGIEIELIPAP